MKRKRRKTTIWNKSKWRKNYSGKWMKKTCEMEKEIDSRKGTAEDKQMHESEEEELSTSQRKRKKKQLPIPPSKRRTSLVPRL